MGWFDRRRGRKKPTGQIVTIDDRELAILDLGSAISRDVRALIDGNTLTHGEPFRTGGVLGASCLPVLGAGSAAASSLFAGNVFLATANPATLMAVKGGVTSAVMGSTGIVAQAPFIAAGTAIVPVVLPVMFFMTVHSMMTSVRFDRLEASLNRLAQMIEEVLKREVAEDYGEVLSAVARLQDISSEFDGSRRFTDEMKIRLALVERDLSAAHYKYDLLTGKTLATETGAKLAPADQHLYALSGVASVYVDRQRLRLALQDNPDDMARSVMALHQKVQRTRTGFTKLLDDNPLLQYQKELNQSLEDMSLWEKHVFRRGEKKERERVSQLVLGVRADDLPPVLSSIQSWSDSMGESGDAGLEQSIVYYRDDDGAGKLRAFYTGDLRLEPGQGAQKQKIS